MAIFGKSYSVTESVSITNMNGTDEEFLSIMAESFKDSYKLEAGMYVADAMMEQQILTEGASAEVLLEGFMGGFWDKTKEFFKKMWEKVKSWFNAFIRAFKIMVLSGEKFIKEFEKELTRKVDTGYEYQSYKYGNLADLDKEHEDILAKVDKEIDAHTLSVVTTISSGKKDNEVRTEYFNKQLEKIYAQYASSRCETPEEVIKEVKEKYLGGTSKEECKDFDNLAKNAMIERVKGLSKTLTKIENANKKVDSYYKKVIKEVESAEKEVTKKDKPATDINMAGINATVGYYRKISSFLTAYLKGISDIHKEVAADCQSVLKGYLRYKPVKESYNAGFDNNQGSSILESAMAYV